MVDNISTSEQIIEKYYGKQEGTLALGDKLCGLIKRHSLIII
jgi:hypothetical protein